MQLTEAERQDRMPGRIRAGAVIGALRRRKWVILGTMLVVNGLALAMLVLVPPRYTATATLLIEAQGEVSGDAGTAADPALVQTQINLLRSPSIAAAVIAGIGLEGDPELAPPASRVVQLRRLLAPLPYVGSLAEWLPTEPPAPESLAPVQAMVPGFLRRLAVSRQPESRVVSVSFESGDREKAARVVNAVVEEYLNSRLAARRLLLDSTLGWVSTRVEELERELHRAEARLTDYMTEHGLARIGPSLPDGGEPPSLRREMAAARAERAVREARLAQLQGLQARGETLAALPEVGGSVIIQNLQQQAALLRGREAQAASTFGTNHPALRELRAEREAIDRRIAAETGNIVRSIVEDAGRARTREREMEQLLGESVQRDMASERAAVRLAELTRAVEAKSTQHRAQLLRLEELQERRELARPGAELVSAATVPQERDFPKPAILLGGGFLGSLVLGLGLAALREQQDSRLRATHQVEQALGLRNLALVPRVHARGPGALHRYVTEKPRSAYSEAIRALALGLDRLLATAPSKVLLVTSALPGEGKTTLAVSLATAMAQRGRRTVIVELDLRRPSVARQLGLGRHASVVEFIEGRSSLDEVVQATGRKHRLDVIAVHREAENPGQLLDSPRLLTLIQLLRQRYDYIVLDAPPSLGIGDVAAIAPAADAALFVARWGSTSSAAARLGVSALVNAGVTVVGCALTQVDLARHARYGYEDAGEYYASYRRYYRP